MKTAAWCVGLLFLSHPALGDEAAPAAPPTTPGKAPTQEEVDAILKELEKEAAALPATPPPPVVTRSVAESLPPWTDMVVPVANLRLRPFVRLGHPTSQRAVELDGHLRAWLGAEIHPTQGVAARLVLSAHQQPPRLTAPGPDLILDAWAQWTYEAMGGEMRLRAGRQALAFNEFILDANDFQLLPPRFDGVSARLARGLLFAQGAVAVDALRTVPAPGTLLDVNALAVVQAGLQDGDGRTVEAHALLRTPKLPVQGDAGPSSPGPVELDVGFLAQWDWKGLSGRASLDVQQSSSQPVALTIPMGGALTVGYAPDFQWALGLYALAGVRAATGQPMRYLPGPLGTWSGWDGVGTQAFNLHSGRLHGVMGEMDVATSQNVGDVWLRMGMANGALKNLGVAFHRLQQLDMDGVWTRAQDGRVMLRPGQGGQDGLIGHEADVLGEVELTRHVKVGGSVGLLWSGPRARDAGYAPFAHTGFMTLDVAL